VRVGLAVLIFRKMLTAQLPRVFYNGWLLRIGRGERRHTLNDKRCTKPLGFPVGSLREYD
jgi:hypothetical protein